MTQCFVKFAPWNEKTLSGIINKTIKFSTVHEFNDFNEYLYLADSKESIKDHDTGKILEILKEEINNIDLLNSVLTYTKIRSSSEDHKEINDLIKTGKQKKLLQYPYYPCLEAGFAFSSVGIFCLSNIEVFNDDSASLMLAHYAQNLKGVALVYQTNAPIGFDKSADNADGSSHPHELEYDGKPSSVGTSQRIINWYNGKYYSSEMKDFLKKSRSWGYEKECRLFAKPGIRETNEHCISLKAIYYTPRFQGCESVLKKVNQAFYNNALTIEEIHNCMCIDSQKFYRSCDKKFDDFA